MTVVSCPFKRMWGDAIKMLTDCLSFFWHAHNFLGSWGLNLCINPYGSVPRKGAEMSGCKGSGIAWSNKTSVARDWPKAWRYQTMCYNLFEKTKNQLQLSNCGPISAVTLNSSLQRPSLKLLTLDTSSYWCINTWRQGGSWVQWKRCGLDNTTLTL